MFRTYLLKTKIDIFQDLSEAWSFISANIGSTWDFTTKLVCTTNPEFVLEAQHNKEFRQIINDSYLSTADGRGVILAVQVQEQYRSYVKGSEWLLYRCLVLFGVVVKVLLTNFLMNTSLAKSVNGVELFEKICQESSQHGYTIALVGGWPRDSFGKPLKELSNIAVSTKNNMESLYSGCKIIYANSSYTYKEEDDNKWVHDINACMQKHGIGSIDFLFVAFGQYKQEKWILRNGGKIKARVAFGVGRTFDYFSGYASRPSHVLQKYGLSWIYSLVTEPWRLKRIFRAVVIFPMHLFVSLLSADRKA